MEILKKMLSELNMQQAVLQLDGKDLMMTLEEHQQILNMKILHTVLLSRLTMIYLLDTIISSLKDLAQQT